MAAKPEVLEWAGSHLGVVFSPDNKFLVTAMHEPALHGWRLADHRHMRMTGYPGRVRSMSWSVGGKSLATSGADMVIMWPFASKDGPMGKEPAMLAPLQARVSAVACHPKQDILAAGYSDGTILMVRLDDGAEILVRQRQGTDPVARWPGTAKAPCWRSPPSMAMPGCWRCSQLGWPCLPGSSGNNAPQRPLIRLVMGGERYVFGRQKTRVQEGFAACLRHGRGGAGAVRCFAGRACRSQSANGAGDATVAIDAGCGIQARRRPPSR